MVSFFDGIAFLKERGIRDARPRFFAVEGAKERGGEQEDLAFFREADQEEGNAPLGEDGFETGKEVALWVSFASKSM